MVVNVFILPDPMLHNRLTVPQVFNESILTFVIVRNIQRANHNIDNTCLRQGGTLPLKGHNLLVYQRRSSSIQVILFHYRGRIECSTLLERASFPR